MAKRYSGDLVVNVLYDDRNFYRAAVSRGGKLLWRGRVNPPASGFSRGIAYDSPEAYDDTARAALSFMQDDFEQEGRSNHDAIGQGAEVGPRGFIVRRVPRFHEQYPPGRIRPKRFASRDDRERQKGEYSSRDMSEDQLRRESASSMERRFNDGLATKKDVTRWVRLSAKNAGRVYQPAYRSGVIHGNVYKDARVYLRRREDLEDKLFKRRAGFWRGRDPRARRDESDEDQRLWDSLSDAGKEYLNEFTSASRREDVLAAWRRVPPRDHRAIRLLSEGMRPGYEQVESQIYSEYGDD